MKIALTVNALLMVIAIIGLRSLDMEDNANTIQTYCEMVEDYQRSEGESGWPDFNENYDEVCLTE